jgi:hypothetical protein
MQNEFLQASTVAVNRGRGSGGGLSIGKPVVGSGMDQYCSGAVSVLRAPPDRRTSSPAYEVLMPERNKCLAYGKPTPCYFINHGIKYGIINFITIFITCYIRGNYKKLF